MTDTMRTVARESDLFVVAEIERRKELLDQLFQESILGVGERDPAHHFWWQALKITHGPSLEFEVFRAIARYSDELRDWLALNYPTKHWISTGAFSRVDHILSVH